MAKQASVATQEQIDNSEDITNESMQEAFDNIDDMSAEALKAALLAARAQLAGKRGRKPKAFKVVEQLSEEELAARQVAIDEAQAEVDRLTGELTDAKVKLRELKPGSGAVGRRGPVGVGAFIKSLIPEGLTNDEIMERVTVEFPDNHTNSNCINWYRNALKNWPDGKRPSKAKEEASEEEASEEAAAE